MIDALFLLKLREDYSSDPSYSGSLQIATGMYNSAKFVVDALNANGVPAEVQTTVDGNTIDAAVMLANPKVVVIEGLWVTPTKIQELMGLSRHAGRKWIIRIHSEIPFLASEGIAMGWIAEYMRLGALVAPNSALALDQIEFYRDAMGIDAELPYLPNCYPTDFQPIHGLDTSAKSVIDIGCFGAYRPLKNHLQQALVAMRFAQKKGKKLRFHVNDRQDAGGQGPFKNVRELFENLPADQFELVLHGWEDRTTFLQSLQDIDLLMQDSFSETFNIVAADATYVGRPVLGSNEIPWLYPLYSDPTDHEKALQVMDVIWNAKSLFVQQNRTGLKQFAQSAAMIWTKYIKSLTS